MINFCTGVQFRNILTMFPVVLPEKMISIYNERKNISIGGEEEIVSDILTSQIPSKPSYEDCVLKIYFLTVFLFLWILCVFVYPLILKDSSSDGNGEDLDNDTTPNDNETDVDEKGEYDCIINQIQNENLIAREDSKDAIFM